jgi:hypothetical protein
MAKFRNGFVSNSSSTSFIINNKTDRYLTLVEFVEENPQLVDQFNVEYDWNSFTQSEMLQDAKRRNQIFKPGESIEAYGDEDGDTLGHVFDYILRDGGDSKSFTWSFYEYNR